MALNNQSLMVMLVAVHGFAGSPRELSLVLCMISPEVSGEKTNDVLVHVVVLPRYHSLA